MAVVATLSCPLLSFCMRETPTIDLDSMSKNTCCVIFKKFILYLCAKIFLTYNIKSDNMKKVSKLCTLMCLITLCTTKLHATDLLVFQMKSGTKISFVLKDEPKFSLQGTKLVATDGNNNTKEIDITELECYYVSKDDNVAGVDKVSENGMSRRMANGHVYYEGLAANAEIRLFTINGQLVGHYKASQTGYVDIDLTMQPKGAYVIKEGKQAIKIINQ